MWSARSDQETTSHRTNPSQDQHKRSLPTLPPPQGIFERKSLGKKLTTVRSGSRMSSSFGSYRGGFDRPESNDEYDYDSSSGSTTSLAALIASVAIVLTLCVCTVTHLERPRTARAHRQQANSDNATPERPRNDEAASPAQTGHPRIIKSQLIVREWKKRCFFIG